MFLQQIVLDYVPLVFTMKIGVCFLRNLFNTSSAFTKYKCPNLLSVSVSNFWLLKRCGYWIKIWKYFHAAEWQVWRRAVQKFIHGKLWRYFIKDASWKLLIQSCKWNHFGWLRKWWWALALTLIWHCLFLHCPLSLVKHIELTSVWGDGRNNNHTTIINLSKIIEKSPLHKKY